MAVRHGGSLAREAGITARGDALQGFQTES
jgi:hypothetical protein